VNFIAIKGPALLSKYVGESEKGVREVFRRAKQAAPCIIFFDEIDALVPVRDGSAADSHVAERVLSQFLAELDGVEELKGVLLLGATNRLDMIDPALLRPGRFDEIVEILLPDEKERKEILEIHLQNKPLAPGIDSHELASKTNGLSGAEIGSLCNKAALQAVRRAIASADDHSPPEMNVMVKPKDIEGALMEIKKPLKADAAARTRN
jgi:transitional endoplasmic reticulum ATPase